ncbi:MAG TPA: BNR-4 repeat-containing protein, partial [Kofleriaceae bacterium]
MRRLSVLLLMASCEPPPGAPAQGAERIRPVVLAEDGAWCWFQDERALFIGERLIVSSVSHDGDVQVSSYDLATGDRQGAVLARLERDDHDVPSLLHRSDGALMAFYTKHNHDSLMRWRVSRGKGGDLSSWEPEQTFDTGVKISYSNPFQLAGEADAVYLFYRSLDISPSFSRSSDGGASWSPPARVIHSFDETRTHRPYVKYASDGAETIHLVYTDGHPNEFNGTAVAPLGNSVYHLYYRAGRLHRSDGSVVAPLVPGQSLDLAPGAGTLVHDGRDGEAFTWDLALDEEGNPVVVYATFPDESSEHATLGDHRYRYARWDGATWHDHAVAFAGRGQTLRSKHASGGIAIDPDAVDTIYFASSVDPIDGKPAGTGAFEIYRGRTGDGGASWRFEPITSDSAIDNIRPIVPARHPTATAVVWMQGIYDEYFDSQNMRVVGLFGPAGARAGERTRDEAIAMTARFDVGSTERAAGFVAVVPDGDGTATATAAGSVKLELSGVVGSEIRPRGGALHRDFAYNDRGGAALGDKLHVRLTGLAPGADHVVRLHQYDPEYHPLAEAYWFDGATRSLEARGNANFLGAHRLVTGTANGAGALTLLL